MMSEESIRVGSLVYYQDGDGPALSDAYGCATVIALDDVRDNRPSAWIRWVSQEGAARYRSVDLADIELIETMPDATAKRTITR
jgi:hypothetical protein